MSTKTNIPTTFNIDAGVNTSVAIMTFANLYSKSTLDVLNEMVQNQIDANAKKSEIHLDLQKRRLVTLDNGEGTTIDDMKMRLGNIGTRFTHGGKIGEKNLGNLAPIGIAPKYAFTSRPRILDPQHPFFTISFDRSQIENKKTPQFKCEIDKKGKRANFSKQGWTTSVTVNKIEKSALRRINEMKDPLGAICTSIASAFREKIKKTGIKINVTLTTRDGQSSSRVVKPLEYPGRREYIEIETLQKGNVQFEMFLTTKPNKKPQILVDYQGRWQFPLRNLDIWSDVSYIFASGYIQGTIRVDFCELLEDRKGFKWSSDLDLLNDAITKFVVNHAQPWIEELEEEKELDKFEEVAKNVLNSLKDSELFDKFPDIFGEIFKGSVSDSHHGKGKKDETKIRTQEKEDHGGTSKPSKKKGKAKDKIHLGVSSPRGTKRRNVRGQKGFQIINGDWAGSRARLGIEGEEEGRIVINQMHPDYRIASLKDKGKSTTNLNRYIEHLVLGLLSTSLCSKESGEIYWREYEDIFMTVLSMVPPVATSRKRITAKKF